MPTSVSSLQAALVDDRQRLGTNSLLPSQQLPEVDLQMTSMLNERLDFKFYSIL